MTKLKNTLTQFFGRDVIIFTYSDHSVFSDLDPSDGDWSQNTMETVIFIFMFFAINLMHCSMGDSMVSSVLHVLRSSGMTVNRTTSSCLANWS